MAEKRFDITTSVRGTEDVDRLRESFEELEDTIRDASDQKLDVEGTEQVAESMRDVAERAEAAGKALVELAEDTRAEMVSAKAATDALANALGPELAGKADMDAIVTDLQGLGLSLEDIRGEADTLATALKQADDVRLTGLSQGVDIANTGMRNLGSSSDQTRSVMANLAGNAAQDLGALSGVVGSLGVGIGQLAEYAVDGNISLKQLGQLAGPIAGLSAFLFAITSANSAVSEFNETQQAVTNEQQSFADSLRESGSQVAVVNELLRENTELTAPPEMPQWADLLNDLPLVGALITDVEERSGGLVETMAAAGITQEEWNASLTSGLTTFGAMHDRLEELRDSGTITGEQFDLLTEQFNLYSDAALIAGIQTDAMARVMESSLGGVNQALGDFSDRASLTGELWDVVMADLRDNAALDTQQAVDAWNRLKVVLGNISDEEMAELANDRLPTVAEATKEGATATDLASEAWLRYHEQVAAAGAELANIAQDMDFAADRGAAFAGALSETNASLSELDQARETITFVDRLTSVGDALRAARDAGVDLAAQDLIPDDWSEIVNMPDELKPVVDALSGFRDVMQTEFTQAFEQGGSTEALEWAANTRQAIVDELARAGIESEEQVNEILAALGLMPDQVTTTIRVSAEERARQVLDDIQGALDLLPAEVATAITLQAPTDPVGALQATITALQEAGIAVPIELVVLAAELDADVETKVAGAKDKVMASAASKVTLKSELDPEGAQEDIDTLTGAEHPTTITADADVIAADQKLDLVALERRVATLTADADTGDADAELDLVALERRVATLTADAETSAAENELNVVARDRTAVIRVVTVGSGSSGGLAMGGGPFGDYVREPRARGADEVTPAPRGAPPMGDSGLIAYPAAEAPVVMVEQEPTIVNLSISAAVIGNSFDVERAVYDAVQDAVRFRGQRQVLTIAGRNA